MARVVLRSAKLVRQLRHNGEGLQLGPTDVLVASSTFLRLGAVAVRVLVEARGGEELQPHQEPQEHLIPHQTPDLDDDP